MVKLNPLVLMCNLEKEMKERGFKVKQEMSKSLSPQSVGPSQQNDRYPLSCLMKTLNHSMASNESTFENYEEKKSYRDISTSGESHAPPKGRNKERVDSSRLDSARVI